MIYKHIALSISESTYLEFSSSESASMTHSIVSLLQEQITIDLVNRVSHSIVSLLQRQTTIDLLIELINERNKLYYVVGLNQKWVCFNDMINAMIYLLTSLYLSVNRSTSSFCSTSEPATKTLSMRWSIYSHRSIS